MSDLQRDREERQHVIEVLQKMVDWMEAANYIVATPERRHALLYAIASIETDLKYDLLHEETSEQADKPTTKNDVSDINVGKIKSTTKNDLVVDWENYKDVDGNSLDDLILEVLQNNFDCGNTYGYKVADEIIELLPSVTLQEPKTGYCKNCKFFELNSWAACGGIPIIVAHEICKAWGEGCKTKIDGYCFLFEPKESEG